MRLISSPVALSRTRSRKRSLETPRLTGVLAVAVAVRARRRIWRVRHPSLSPSGSRARPAIRHTLIRLCPRDSMPLGRIALAEMTCPVRISRSLRNQQLLLGRSDRVEHLTRRISSLLGSSSQAPLVTH